MFLPTLFNRLNKIWPCAFVAGMIATTLMLPGCKKKERLTASTFSFSITPPASTVLKTESITLMAKGSSASGSVDVNPTWSVSPTTLGSLNTTIGRSVVFQPTGLGDVVVTGVYDGIAATSQIAIVTYKPTANTFDIYNDNGLPAGSDVDSDIFTSGGLSLTELSSGYTPEGSKYEHTTNAITNNFWGVTVDKLNTGKRKDLSGFSSGALKFSLRLARSLSVTESIRIDIVDSAQTVSYTLSSGSDNYNRLSTDWQEISLSLPARFATLDSAHVKVPFVIVPTALGAPLTFDVDAVRWER